MKQLLTKFGLLMALLSIGVFSANAQSSLSGNYTIGAGTGYDYSSVAAAATALTSNGVSGAVVFSIADGTYSGQVSLGSSISGASATNTITFKSSSADSSKVTITNSGTYTVYVTGSDYISFEDVTIQNTSTSTHYNVYLSGSSDYFTISNSRVISNQSGGFSYNVYSSRNEFLTVENSRVMGGYYGVYNFGSGTGTSASDGMHIENNQFIRNGYYGIYSRNQREYLIKGNMLDSMVRTGIAIYSYYDNMARIEDNELFNCNYGLYFFYGNYVGNSTDTTVIANNITRNMGVYGFYANRLDRAHVYHNVFESVSGRYAMYWYNFRLNDVYFANNILVGGGFYGFYAYFGGTSYQPKLWDYNDYWLSNYTYYCYFNGTLAASFAALKSANTNFNQNCVTVDPTFPTAKDGRTYAPALNNIGLDVGIKADIDGNLRPNSTDKKVDIGANDFYLAPKDLDVSALISPLSVSLTSNTLTAEFKNAGSDTLRNTTVYVQYSVDSGSTWITDTMTITSLVPGAKQQFTFSKTWTPTRSGYFRVSIRISQSVSGDPDSKDQEDYDICSGLTGTFTIGGTTPDFTSFGDALKALECGVAGPVVFNVRAGTYTENLSFGELLGSSASNTVTFVGAGRGSTILRSTGGNTITLSGTDRVAFEDMDIRMDGSSGFTVSITGNADHNRFENCLIHNNTGVISTAALPIVISGSSTQYWTRGANGHHNEFIDNDIRGGYFGVYITGASTSDPTKGNVFLENSITQAYFYGFYAYYNDSLMFKDNRVDSFRNSNYYGFYNYYGSNFDIQRNYLPSTYGCYLSYANRANYNGIERSTFANNMVMGGSNWAIYGFYMTNVNFWHNSVYGDGRYLCYWYLATDNDIRNNIFYYEGSTYALYFINQSFVEWDFNDYYITGGNLAYIGGSNIANVSALAAWNSNYNQNNLDENPEWVDKEEDHTLTSKSPDMFGANIGIAEDHFRDKRCLFAPTMGADELTKVSLPPSAQFLAPDTAWLGSPAVILNSNKPSKLVGATWYVNDSLVSDSIHLEYTPVNTGMDTIKLVMENCSGKDSITKYVYVSPILRAPKVDFSATSTDIYTGDIIRFLDLSANGVTQWTWDISPKLVYDPFLGIYVDAHYFDTTKANPSGYFDYPGVYTVKLKVANSFGADSVTRTAYIKVRQRSKMCDIPFDTDGEFGTLYDDGGPDGSYSPNLSGFNRCTYLISSCRGEIEFDVDQFDLGEDDYLKVYDGDDEAGRPLWDAATHPDGMTGNKSDKSVTLSFTAKSGSAYFVFESDNNAQTLGKGFAIDWEYVPVTWTNPTASISAPDTACTGFPTVFTNTSTGNWSYVDWDIDMDGNSDGSGDFFTHTFTKPGYDTIFLKAHSLCADADSITKVIFIEDATKPAKPDFSASATVVSAGDTLSFAGTADYCVSGFNWEISPANYLLANNTTVGDQDIDVVFTKGGFYTVELESSNPKGKDSIIKVNYIQVLDYCIPSVVNLNPDLGISRVVFGDIDNSSNTGRYSYNNYLYISTDVERGHSYPITIERPTNTREMSRKVWIDWNIDGDFDDAGEEVLSEDASTNMSFVDTITIDPNAKPGKTRMRIGTNYKRMPNRACGPHAFGEFEDYSVVILAEDKTPPTLTLTGATVDTIEVFGTWTEPGYTASDLVDGNMTADVVVTNGLDNTTVGTYTITYTVTDKSSNTTVKTRTIVVEDTTFPTISLDGKDSVWVQIFTSYDDEGSTADDNYDKPIVPSVISSVDTANLGTYQVTYCVTDAAGNGPVCVTRTVIVGDTILPVVSLNGNSPEVVDVFSNYEDAGVTASDNHDYTVTTSGTYEGTDSLGTFTLTYTVTDPAGNMVSVTREIEVVDRVAPVLTLDGNLVETVERWSDYTDAGYTVTDNYYDASVDVTVTQGGTFVNTQSEGVYTLTYTAEDPSGNVSATVQRLVVVEHTNTGIDPIANDGYRVFPNPTSGPMVVSTTLDNGESTQLRVLDLTGKEVMNLGNHIVSNGQLPVDLSNLATGTYYLEIASEGARIMEKVVIAR